MKSCLGVQKVDKLTIAEEAYKNGYEKGKKDAVKHGRWVQCKDWDYDYECSICEGYAGEDTDGNYNKLSHYCPNCGAMMDGDADDK